MRNVTTALATPLLFLTFAFMLSLVICF
jgi:hypothetical protein